MSTYDERKSFEGAYDAAKEFCGNREGIVKPWVRERDGGKLEIYASDGVMIVKFTREAPEVGAVPDNEEGALVGNHIEEIDEWFEGRRVLAESLSDFCECALDMSEKAKAEAEKKRKAFEKEVREGYSGVLCPCCGKKLYIQWMQWGQWGHLMSKEEMERDVANRMAAMDRPGVPVALRWKELVCTNRVITDCMIVDWARMERILRGCTGGCVKVEVLEAGEYGMLVRVTSESGRECAILNPMSGVPSLHVIKMKRVVQP